MKQKAFLSTPYQDLDKEKSFLSALSAALCLHVILLFLLMLQFKSRTSMPGLQSGPPVIQAFLKPVQVVSASSEMKNESLVFKVTPPIRPQLKLKHEPALPLKRVSIAKKKKQKSFEKKISSVSPAPTYKEKALPSKTTTPVHAGELMQGQVDKYKALILQAIEQNWILPPEVNQPLCAELLIHLAPDGTVLEVSVSHTSGNAKFDQSALLAVQKASPLPVPDDFQTFQMFRELRLSVKPDLNF